MDWGFYSKPIERVLVKGRTVHYERYGGQVDATWYGTGVYDRSGDPNDIADLHLNWLGDELEGTVCFEGKVYPAQFKRGMDFSLPRLGSDGKAQTDYVYRPPQKLSDGWETGDLGKQVKNLGPLESGIKEILDQNYSNIHSVVLVKDGKIVLDEYFYGYGPQDEHQVCSVTKSVFSTLFGIACDQGLFKPEQKLYDFFPEYRSKSGWNKKKDRITLGMLLSMSSGLAGEEWSVPYSSSKNDFSEMYASRDWLDFTLSKPLERDPGKAFNYCSSCLTPLGVILSKKSGLSVPDFAQKYLYDPLGIQARHWMTGPNGVVHVSAGHWLRPRDMAKLGQLFLNQGQWNGKQVISKQWVERATSTQITVDMKRINQVWGYGYLWWLAPLSLHGKPLTSYSAWGAGGQYIWVVPELNLVGVITSGNYNNPYEMFMQIDFFEKNIVNALF